MGLTRFMNIWVRSGFCIGSHVLIIAYGADQSNELSMLGGDNGNLLNTDCTIRVFQSCALG